jgi:hypothetical protein
VQAAMRMYHDCIGRASVVRVMHPPSAPWYPNALD